MIQLLLIIMFGKILKYGSLSIIAGGYIYISQFNKLKLNNPFVRSGLKYLDRQVLFLISQSPEYAMMFFKMLMKIDVLGRDGELGKYVLQAGFDDNAHYLKQLERIGFKGVEIGPVSLNPSLNEEKQNHLGIIYTLANICAFKNQKKISNFLIYLNIAPNEQILKYAPYILDDNILEAINRFVEIQGKMDVGLIDKIRVSFDKNGYQLQSLQIK